MRQRPMTPEEIEAEMLATMQRAGTAPELVYAFRKTKRILTEKTYKQVSPEERAEWDGAIAEYFATLNAKPSKS